jgi:TatD DNase family protein
MRPNQASLRFVDTHAHLDDESFAGEMEEVIERARAAGVDRVINIGYRPDSWRTTLELAQRFSGVAYTLGLHPNHADEDAEPIWSELRRLIKENRPVAIGEIGLDYYRDYAPKATQLRVFDRQLDLAAEFGLPVVIHQRTAEDDVRAGLRSWTGSTPWILHSFDGSRDFAEEAAASGAYFGVGGLMTRAGSSELRSILAELPLDRLLLETDSPYLVPRGVKNRRNEPSNVPLIAATLAALRGLTVEEIAETTATNAGRVFGLPDDASIA